eukprot:TRINITY_DN108606_c0_g1_i1.p1 TRINITY_DN108606_c0_g1~~TRINITY_DN108606_c0_g1_i1.p1  ORF type:complete len:114 (+),score=28.36 TRINITY_DN108606_c0_g1_i1:152-493(+)
MAFNRSAAALSLLLLMTSCIQGLAEANSEAVAADFEGKKVMDQSDCHKECSAENEKHLGDSCKMIRHRLKQAKSSGDEQQEFSLKNALKMCEQTQQHHEDHCVWRCGRHEDEL